MASASLGQRGGLAQSVDLNPLTKFIKALLLLVHGLAVSLGLRSWQKRQKGPDVPAAGAGRNPVGREALMQQKASRQAHPGTFVPLDNPACPLAQARNVFKPRPVSLRPRHHRFRRRSERHFLLAGLATPIAASTAAKAAAGLRIPFAAEQLQPVDPDHRLAPFLASAAVGPAVQLEGTDDPQQRALADIISGHLGLLAPDLKVEPVGFVPRAAPVHGKGEVGDHAAGFEVTHFGVAAGPADQGDRVDAHGRGWKGLEQ